MKALKISITVIIILALAIVISFQIFFRLPHPGYSGTTELEGLTSKVEVRTDDYGVPHIFADNEADLFFAQGFITARERMFQMDMTRLAGRGELSTLFGEVTIDTDRFLKTVGFYRAAEAEYKLLPRELKDVIDAYTDGVNAYLDTAKHLPREYVILGVEPELWKPEDTVVSGSLMAYSLTRSKKADLILYRIGEAVGKDILNYIIPSYPDFAPTVSMGGDNHPSGINEDVTLTLYSKPNPPRNDTFYFPIPTEIPASNWMILSGTRTTTGNPIFAASPDLEPTIPALFYLIHLKGGDYDVIGGSLPGAPGVNVLGFNGKVAWSTVNGRVDELDYFIEKINPENPNQYLTEEGYEDFEIVEETLRIKTEDGIKEEKLEVKISRHGPMISDVMTLAPENCAMLWVGLQPTGIFEGFMALNRAGNFDEFRSALSHIRTPTLNIGYADIQGNIGYQYVASPPIRKKGDGTLPVSGHNGKYEWVGYVPFEELPYDYNPDKAYLASFNNPPQRTTYHMTNYFLFERALRFEEIVKGRDKFSLENVRKMQLDTVSVVAKRWVPHILRVCKEAEELTSPLMLFEKWDYSIDIESSAATLFNSFYFHMMENTLEDEIGEELWVDHLSQPYLIYIPDMVLARIVEDNEHILFDNAGTTDIKEIRDDIIKRSMKDAVDELSERLGDKPENWGWGEVHRMVFKHPMGSKLSFFNLSPISTQGDDFTINAGLWDTHNAYEMKSGGVIRMVVDFSDLENSTMMSPPGQSGHYMSPYYDDVAEMWAEGGQIPMYYLSGKDLPEVLTLKPKQQE